MQSFGVRFELSSPLNVSMYLPPPSSHPAMISHLSLRSSPLAAHAPLFWNTRVHGAFYSLLVLFLGLVHSQNRGSAPGRCEEASFILYYRLFTGSLAKHG